MFAIPLDLYYVYPYRNKASLKPDRAVNEPDLPILVLIRDGDREYVVKVDTVDTRIDAYSSLTEYLQQVRREESQWLKNFDIVVTVQGLYPFRRD